MYENKNKKQSYKMKCTYQLFSQTIICAFAQPNVPVHYYKLVLLPNLVYS